MIAYMMRTSNRHCGGRGCDCEQDLDRCTDGGDDELHVGYRVLKHSAGGLV